MVATVPSLTGSLYLKDPQEIIAYTLNRYSRQPGDTVPILSDMIISLPYQIARFGKEPDVLVRNIQSDLQGVLSRIFAGERDVTVSATHTPIQSGNYDVTISVIYTTISGDADQTGVTISLKNGRLVIPSDTISPWS